MRCPTNSCCWYAIVGIGTRIHREPPKRHTAWSSTTANCSPTGMPPITLDGLHAVRTTPVCGYRKDDHVHDGFAPGVLSAVGDNGYFADIALATLGRGQYQRDDTCEFRVGFSFPYPEIAPSKYQMRVEPGQGGL
jgi:hypothetical protein